VQDGGLWKVVANGTTIGSGKEVSFTPVKTRWVRLNVSEAINAININEFQIFAP